MLAKWIVCQVPYALQTQFSLAQQSWKSLANTAGFLAQLGGFFKEEAHILAIWQDAASYQAFMDQQHDGIAKGQHSNYLAIQIACFEIQFEMLGFRKISLKDVILEAQYLRIADCLLLPERQAHFIEMQKTVWHPGVGNHMLAGAFWRDDSRFLVTTLWASGAAHQEYMDTQFPLLYKIARPEDDLSAINGVHLMLIPEWMVIAQYDDATVK
jgi:heme-degrading monooxygenase HmoA